MSYFWEQRLTQIREQLLLMSGFAELGFAQSIRALSERNDKLVGAVEAGDEKIDALEIRVDELVATYMATHAPTARDCRLMLAASKISNNLERVGDEATKIARCARELNVQPALSSPIDLAAMAGVAQVMLHDSMTAFADGNHEGSKEIIARDRVVDDMKRQMERELTEQMTANPRTVTRALQLLTAARAVERVADHAKNIAEEVFYFCKAQDIRHAPPENPQ